MKRFLVVGDANVDLIVSGLPTLPVLGQELLCDDFRMVLGGSSANCASWLTALGAQVDFWGKVGCDPFGEFTIRELDRRGIGVDGMIEDPDIRTGVCVSLSYPDDRALITFLGSISALRLDDIDLDLLGNYDHLHSASIFLQHGLRSGLSELFRAAKEAGLSTSLDSGWDPEERWVLDIQNLLKVVDIFMPSDVEVRHLTGASSIEDGVAALAQHGSLVVAKLGKDGAMARMGEERWHVPAFEVDVVDTTGAGDGFNAGFLLARVGKEATVPDALHFANACGAIAVTTFGGSSIPNADEVRAFIDERR
ncbi:MAG: carbohydrate kinase [Anaerolineales bacterium]|nr:carbohydrate kinase [Anaerolineales bacterium]